MSYTRSREESLTFRKAYTKISTTKVVNQSYAVRVFRSSRTGTSLPDWRARIKARSNATTPYSLDALKMEKTMNGNYTVQGSYGAVASPKGISQSFEGINSAPNDTITHLSTDGAAAEAKALTSLYTKVNREISQAKVPSALVEFGSVIRQFGSPFRSIIKLTERHINRLYLQRRGIHALKYNKAQLSKTLADTYLEYAFGLAPLINDTKAAAEALARWEWETHPDNTRLPTTKLVGRGTDAASTSTLTKFNGPFGGVGDVIYLQRQHRITTERRVQYVCGYGTFLTADLGSLDRLNQLLGFRPESWIPAIWEAVPWSWLVDYFTNVQGILDSVSASLVKPIWISKAVTTATVVESVESLDISNTTRIATNSGWRDLKVTLNKPGGYVCRRTTFDRTVPSTLGLPSIYFQLPDSMRQFANMSAVLLAQQKSAPMLSLEQNYRSFLRR